MCASQEISAFDKNLNANANSKKPKNTFTLFNHPPEEGKVFNQDGKNANNANGKPNANPNPAIPTVKFQAPPPAEEALANKAPNIGPVQENDTNAKVTAIKNTPTNPPKSDFESALLVHFAGITISNAPKNDNANMNNMAKKKTFKGPNVAILFNILGSNESNK